MRSCLASKKLMLDSEKEIIIERVYAQGSLSIVYIVSCYDKKYFMKELYSEGLSEMGVIDRNIDGSVKIQPDNPYWKQACKIFKDEAERLLYFSKQPDVSGYIAEIEGLYSENGILYTLSPWTNSVSWDMIDNESITQILNATIQITNMTQMFHDYGYIAVDIKPSNYIVSYDKNNMPWISMADLNGFIKSDDITDDSFLMYSSMTAAPEFYSDDRKLIGVHSDVYGIAMMLLRKITGDMYTNDMNVLYKKAEQRLAERADIWKKTVACALKKDISMRTKNCEKLAADLKTILELENCNDSCL